MVAFDAGFLSILFHPNPGIPADPSTQASVTSPRERVECLIDTLSDTGEKIIIPTPALAEVLIALGRRAATKAVTDLHGESVFKIESFDERAAIELSQMAEVRPGQKKQREQVGTWAKINFDRQIVAIAKVNGAKTIYSTDEDVRKLATREGLLSIALHELPLPPPSTPRLPFPETQSDGESEK